MRRFLTALAVTVGMLGGLAAGISGIVIVADTQPDSIERNGNLTSCAVGRTAQALVEVGHSVIPAEELENRPPLRRAFADLEAALVDLEVDIACRRIESG